MNKTNPAVTGEDLVRLLEKYPKSSEHFSKWLGEALGQIDWAYAFGEDSFAPQFIELPEMLQLGVWAAFRRDSKMLDYQFEFEFQKSLLQHMEFHFKHILNH